MSNWTLFSNHGHVLVCLSRDSEARLRDVALNVGITERAVQKIVRDLQDGDMISVTKSGRRNRYRIHDREPLRHDLEANCTVKDLIKTVNKTSRIAVATLPAVSRDSESAASRPKPVNRQIERPTANDKQAEILASKKTDVEVKEIRPISPRPAKPKSDSTKKAKRKERQQGSLF